MRTESTTNADRLLRTTLTVNAEISLVWGLVAVVGAWALADLLGVPPLASVFVGAVTLVAAGLFWRFRSRDELRALEGWIAAIGDVLFGAALIVAAIAAQDPTVIGRWIIGLSGVAVLALGILEIVGVRRLARPSSAARRIVQSASRVR